MPRFFDFVMAMSAAYETRLAAPPMLTRTTVARMPAVELLYLFAGEGSDTVLRCASGIGERTLQGLRLPLSGRSPK